MQPVPPFPARREGMGMGQMNKIFQTARKSLHTSLGWFAVTMQV
jgi:hypothetical protein